MSTLHQVLISPRIGGAAAVAIRLTAAARARSLRCMAWVPGAGPASDTLSASRIPWRMYQLDAMRNGRLWQLISCGRMAAGLRNGGRPVVHVHNPVVYRLLYPALLAARARTVVHVQIEPAPGEIEWAFKFPPDHVVTCAAYIGERIKELMAARAPSMRITAVPNSIDVAYFAGPSAALPSAPESIPRGRHVVLMLANLAPHKGQTTALRAVHRLVQRGVQVEVWLAGEDRTGGGNYERELRALTTELGLSDHVKFLGFRPDTRDLLQAADVLVLPSTHEGLPLAVLEAQAAGVPVVASPLPGIMEVVEDGSTGLVVRADDDEGYAEAVLRLVGDQSLRDSIVCAARDRVAKEYGWDTFEQRMFTIYESLMS